MRVIIQRVSRASVSVEGQLIASIGSGLMVLIGFEREETPEEMEWMSSKIVNLRIFDDEDGVMNRSIIQTEGDILAISQFTLFAKTKKGNRPSYILAAPAEISIPYYQHFIKMLNEVTGKEIKTGIFGAEMAVELVNDGPVTIFVDSKNRDF